MSIKEPSEELLKFGTKKLDKNQQAHLLAETAKACYVMSRPILTSDCLWYYPASLHIMHHSIESFTKAFLLREDIKFETGKNGHKLTYLIDLGIKSTSKLKFFETISQDKQIMSLLVSLENSYSSNKYWEVSFSAKMISIVDIFDKLVSIFTEQFHTFYGNPRKEASVDVPEELADLIERNRKYLTTLCIVQKYEK